MRPDYYTSQQWMLPPFVAQVLAAGGMRWSTTARRLPWRPPSPLRPPTEHWRCTSWGSGNRPSGGRAGQPRCSPAAWPAAFNSVVLLQAAYTNAGQPASVFCDRTTVHDCGAWQLLWQMASDARAEHMVFCMQGDADAAAPLPRLSRHACCTSSCSVGRRQGARTEPHCCDAAGDTAILCNNTM
jgi:hypothetical protein